MATQGLHIKLILDKYARETGGELNGFAMNDFGARGVSSGETSEVGGCAHLVNYIGTDNIEGIMTAKRYYKASAPVGMSVFATEHSTTTIYLKDGEEEAYRKFLTVVPPEAVVSIVLDSYDDVNAVKELLGKRLKDIIVRRPGKTVFRPDSGEPTQKIVEISNLIWEAFGGSINDHGYKVFHPSVGGIYGDGIEFDSIDRCLQMLALAKYCTTNWVFGSGGGLLQKLNRDTQKFAIKCSAAKVDGKWRDVYKETASKKSKRGRLKLVNHGFGKFTTVPEDTNQTNELTTVFLNGTCKQEVSFDEIRKRAEDGFSILQQN